MIHIIHPIELDVIFLQAEACKFLHLISIDRQFLHIIVESHQSLKSFFRRLVLKIWVSLDQIADVVDFMEVGKLFQRIILER